MFSRRTLISAGAATLVAPALSLGAAPKKALRVAHLTDFHIQPELNAYEGSRKTFAHAMRQKPDLILSGGDHVMDAFEQNEARTKLQWDLFDKLRKEHAGIPLRPALGNHDVWGWFKKQSATDGSEPLWGKRWFCDFFEIPRTYYSFDQGGWHFVVLDNVKLVVGEAYDGEIDPEQMEWLKEDLGKTTKPTLVMSHIPLMSVTSLALSYDPKPRSFIVTSGLMTNNLSDVQALFRDHPQVKVALSGHTHRIDRIDYDGVAYLCGGAVSGNWWKGPVDRFQPGYRILDLHEDGSFTEQFHEWGWTSA